MILEKTSDRIKSLSVTNEHVECGIALVQAFSGCLTHDKEQLQFLLQVLAKHCKKFPDALKKTVTSDGNRNSELDYMHIQV